MQPPCTALLALSAVLLVSSLLRPAEGITITVKNAVQSPLGNWYGNPKEEPDCTVPGQCVPLNQTIAANTLYYWCGWRTKNRSYVYVSSTSSKNLTTFLMRENEFRSCVLTNLTNAKNCWLIPGGNCDKVKTCDFRFYGLAFNDDMCLGISNNNNVSLVATIKYVNTDDSPRYYGAIFSIIIAIVFLSGFISTLAYRMYNEWVHPLHKLDHMDSLKEQRKALTRPLTESEIAIEQARPPNHTGSFVRDAFTNAVSKFKFFSPRSKPLQA